MIKKLCTLLTLLPVLLFTTARFAVADVILEINGNSNDSNQISLSSGSQTAISQNNSGTVTNTVDANAATGSNTVSANTGDPSVTTGEISASIDVENLFNTSIVSKDCCDHTTDNTVSIEGNSNRGDNTVKGTVTRVTSTEVVNNAHVRNVTGGNLTTGSNNASHNTGRVTITTGDIKHIEAITNKHINYNKIIAGSEDPGWNIKIKNNTNDDNHIVLSIRNDVITRIYNNAAIDTISLWNHTTGNNTANSNTNSTVIVTGSITNTTSIKNDGINVNRLITNCCNKPAINNPGGNTPPPPTTIPTPKPSGNISLASTSGGTGGNGSSGAIGGIMGDILPATGASFWLFATIANILMFLLGLYLRLRAGRSPCYAYATR